MKRRIFTLEAIENYKKTIASIENSIELAEKRINELVDAGYRPIWKDLNYAWHRVQEDNPYQYECNKLVMFVQDVYSAHKRIKELKQEIYTIECKLAHKKLMEQA